MLMSTDKKNWTPINWTKETAGTDVYWMSLLSNNKDSRKRYFMRDSEVPIGFGSDAGIHMDHVAYAIKPSFKLGGNVNSLLCKNFSTLTDISGLDKCFINAIGASLVTNIDELMLPSKQIGLSCYDNFSSSVYSNGSDDLSSAGFTIDVEDIPSYGCYRLLWYNKMLVNGPKFTNLKSIGNYGLAYAFQLCQKLANGPKFTDLTSIGDHGLEYAFNNCSSLTSVELPSTPIPVGSYGCRNAFSESGIKAVENLNLSGIGQYGCQGMFLSCADLEKVDGLSAESLSAYALSGMFYKCSSLTAVQDLYIDNSEDADKKKGTSICDNMFGGCNSLLSVGGLIKGVYGQFALRYMFRNCKSLKDASKLSVEVNYGSRYTTSTFENCSELESMPVLLSGEAGPSV